MIRPNKKVTSGTFNKGKRFYNENRPFIKRLSMFNLNGIKNIINGLATLLNRLVDMIVNSLSDLIDLMLFRTRTEGQIQKQQQKWEKVGNSRGGRRHNTAVLKPRTGLTIKTTTTEIPNYQTIEHICTNLLEKEEFSNIVKTDPISMEEKRLSLSKTRGESLEGEEIQKYQEIRFEKGEDTQEESLQKRALRETLRMHLLKIRRRQELSHQDIIENGDIAFNYQEGKKENIKILLIKSGMYRYETQLMNYAEIRKNGKIFKIMITSKERKEKEEWTEVVSVIAKHGAYYLKQAEVKNEKIIITIWTDIEWRVEVGIKDIAHIEQIIFKYEEF